MSSSVQENSTDLSFEILFKHISDALRINMSHPKARKDFKWCCKLSVLQAIPFSIFCLLIYSIIFHDLKNNDIAQACSNGILILLYIITTIDYCVMLFYCKVLNELIERMDADYQLAKSFSKKEQDIVSNFARKGQRLTKMWLLICICTSGLFVVKQITLQIYYYVTKDFKLIHLYELTYPDAVEQVKNNYVVYSILYVYFLFYDLFCACTIYSFFPLGPIFILHACGQLEIARYRISTIFNENNSIDDVDKELKNVAKFLNTAYSFIDRIRDGFKVSYELSIKLCTVIMPVSFYQILASLKRGDFRIEFVNIVTGSIMLCSIPCYYSDMLEESGYRLSMEIYTCGWETFRERKSRKMVLLLLHRASRSVTIRSMFRSLSLDALTDVYHQAYAIFNLLNAAWN